MKTTITVPDEEFQQLMEYTGARNKREAVLHAIKDFNRRRRLEKLSGILGTFKEFMSRKELEVMREDEKWQ
jgi:hypothetical protein